METNNIDHMEIDEPYKGLRPYEEENQGIFFGREQEKDILIDKIISNKLTLLFAATGVGKSSLLQAAVMPGLKQPPQANLDVVYYNDWVSDPISELKEKTIQVLGKRGKMSPGFNIDRGLLLKDFFQLCCTFSSDPLVIILDQFEEFFQYQKYREGYKPFIEQFSACLKDRLTPAVFVVSMREDFALELNAFKDYLSTMLFENYFRLEKLSKEKAREAICKPVEKLEFRYEDELLNNLLKDLAEREKEAQLGAASASVLKDSPSYVEPPYLQIVCSQLWDDEKGNPGKLLRYKTYEDKGKAKGYVDSYFKNVMDEFSLPDRKIASSAFNHLVTPRGTKMAYPVKDLSGLLRIEEKKLADVLERLCKSRILRTRKREGVLWYELYHDIFSSIIQEWNEKFKARQRRKKTFIIGAMVILAAAFLFVFYDFIRNSTGHYLRLSPKTGISDTIEIYRGKPGTWDIFNKNQYLAETSFQRYDVEADKQFDKKQTGDFNDVNVELIGLLPVYRRISAYYNNGEIQKAIDLSGKFFSSDDRYIREYFNRDIRYRYTFLYEMKTDEAFEKLKTLLEPSNDNPNRTTIAKMISEINTPLGNDFLITLWKDQDAEIRGCAVDAMARKGGEKFVTELTAMIADEDPDVRRKAVELLLKVKNSTHNTHDTHDTTFVLNLLNKKDPIIRECAANFLGNNKNADAVEPLIALLNDTVKEVRKSSAEALGKIRDKKAEIPLIKLMNTDPDLELKMAAMDALGNLKSTNAVTYLNRLLGNQDERIAVLAASTLHKLGFFSAESLKCIFSNNSIIEDLENSYYISINAIPTSFKNQTDRDRFIGLLINFLNDGESTVREKAADYLGRFNNPKAITPLKKLLKDTYGQVQLAAALSLLELGAGDEIEPWRIISYRLEKDLFDRLNINVSEIDIEGGFDRLVELLKDSDYKVRRGAAMLLGETGRASAVKPVSTLLKDENTEVRLAAIKALGNIGSEKAIEFLLPLRQDPDKEVRNKVIESLESLGFGQNDEMDWVWEKKTPETFITLINRLKYGDWRVRQTAAEALGKMGNPQAVDYLIEALKDEDYDVRASAAEALGRLGRPESVVHLIKALEDENQGVQRCAAAALSNIDSPRAFEYLKTNSHPFLKRYFLSKLNTSVVNENQVVIKAIYANPNEERNIRSTAAAVLLTMEDKEAIEFLNRVSKSSVFKERLALAEILGDTPSKPGTTILIAILNDEEMRVRVQAIQSLGNSKEISALIELIKLYKDPNKEIRNAVDAALENIAVPKSTDKLKEIALNTGSRLQSRLCAVDLLGKTRDESPASILIQLLEEKNEMIRYRTALAIQVLISSHSLSDASKDRLLKKLKRCLTEIDTRKMEWRRIRDENTERYNDTQMKAWQKKLEEKKPEERLEYEIAYAIALIDPDPEGINLLGHNLARVRAAAWTGLGESHDIALMEEIYKKRRESDLPWLKDAAYRAIDGILSNIEITGDKKELADLDSRYNKLVNRDGKNMHPGIKSRMKWTIDRLK